MAEIGFRLVGVWAASSHNCDAKWAKNNCINDFQLFK